MCTHLEQMQESLHTTSPSQSGEPTSLTTLSGESPSRLYQRNGKENVWGGGGGGGGGMCTPLEQMQESFSTPLLRVNVENPDHSPPSAESYRQDSVYEMK